jgi:transcriptional regulator of arginine metabolism
MSKKPARHSVILELVSAHAVASQDALRKLLEAQGIFVTQATLSRDLRELGLVRAQTEDGLRYVLQDGLGDDAKPSLESLLPQLFSSIDGVGELIVLHTLASGAQPISEAIDAEAWEEVLGTIAGENTILIVCRSQTARHELTTRLTQFAERG